MSKVNRISPPPGQDGESYPLQNVAKIDASRHMDSQESLTKDVPSNWDVDSTPRPKQTGHQDKHEEHGKWSEWDSESDQEKDDQFKATDYKKDTYEAQGIDAGRDGTDNKGQNREDEYTPELPEAETLKESVYENPDTSRSDVNVYSKPAEPKAGIIRGLSQQSQSPLKKGGPKLARKSRDANTGLEISDNEVQEDIADSSVTQQRALSRRNRVSPLDDTATDRSKGQYYMIAKEEELKKKSTIFGADDNTDSVGCCGWLLYTFSILLIVVTLPFSLVFCIKVVQEYERAVIFRLGRLPSGGAKGPGIFFIIPCIESYTKIDLRTVSFDVPPQEVLTKDSVTVSVDAVVYYRVSNPTISVANVENAHHSTRLLAQTTLRNILGTKNMSEILSDRESISQGMQSTLDEATENWGIKVERVEMCFALPGLTVQSNSTREKSFVRKALKSEQTLALGSKDVRLPVQLQRAMAAEAEAAREARAKVIAAEGEQKASHALKEAADVMAQSSAALQLRYLQTLSSISAEKNSTIIFPLPIDLLKAFMDKKS